MKLKLDETYTLGSDSRQFTLYKRQKNNNKWVFRVVGHYSSLINVFTEYMATLVRRSKVDSIKQLIDFQVRENARITALIKNNQLELSRAVKNVKY